MRDADHFVGSAHVLDEGHRGWGRRGRLMMRSRRPVEQAELTVASVAVHPFRRRRPRDTHLRSNVGDGAFLAALDQPSPPLQRQWCIVVPRHPHATGGSPRSAKTFFAVRVAFTARGKPQ